MSIGEKEISKPKGAMSAYAYFVQVIREEHKRKHPGDHVVFSEFSKKCAEKWKLLTSKEKKRFEEMAATDKDRYNKEMTNYQPKEGVGRKRRKRRRIKEPGQPKRAWSAFFFFCNEFRPKIRELHPEWRVGNIAKELGKLWEACTSKEKYEKQSEADKQRYEEQMSLYRAGQYVPPVKRPTAEASSSQEASTEVVEETPEDDSDEEEEEVDDDGKNNEPPLRMTKIDEESIPIIDNCDNLEPNGGHAEKAPEMEKCASNDSSTEAIVNSKAE